MKKIITLVFLCMCLNVYSQVPQKMSYQSIIRNASGTLVTNANVGIRISIIKDSATGSVAFVETHNVLTNANGLANLAIGTGTAVTGTFAAISWGSGSHFIKTETDVTGGTNYSIVSTSELASVPYAQYAEKVNPAEIKSIIPKYSSTASGVYTATNAYAFYQYQNGSGNWLSQSLSGIPLGAIADSSQLCVYTATNAYAFYQYQNGSGNWLSQSLNGTPLGIVAAQKAIVIYTATNAYAFYQYQNGSGNWLSQTLNGKPIGAVASGNSIVIYTATNAYAFYQYQNGSGNWLSQSLSGMPLNGVASANKVNIYTATNAYGFYQYQNGSGNWLTQSLNGTPVNGFGGK